MNRLSVRLFLSYLVVVLASTGVAFVTARALAPTFFRVNLQQGRPDSTPGSTIGPGGARSSSTPAPSAGPDGSRPGSTVGPDPSDRSGPTTRNTGNEGSGPGQGGTASTQRAPGGTGAGSSGTGVGGGGDAAIAPGTVAVGAIEQTLELDEEVTEAFRGAIDSALALAFGVSMLVAMATSWLVARRIMLPISQVRDATLRLAEGRYAERVPVPAETELAALAHDVNRLAATLEATEEQRKRLISDVAHELRTPLTTIQGSMEGLMDGVLQPTDEVFASVADEAGRLQRVVADLGLLSRLDEAALPMSFEPVDLASVARTVAERLRPQYDDKSVALELRLDDELRVSGDRDRLAQVFTNLIGNALLHTPADGRVTVTSEQAGGFAEVKVIDTGDGIAADELESIFDRFHRARGSKRHGTGLGLTIARSLARAHGGDVAAASPGPGRGATFTVRLPADEPAGPTGGWNSRA